MTGCLRGARTRRFARRSAIGSLMLGVTGQIAYHLLAQAHATRAPWPVTTAVSCLPVLVLGMGAPAQPIRADAHRSHAYTTAKPRKQGRKHHPHPPCRLCAWSSDDLVRVSRAPIARFCPLPVRTMRLGVWCIPAVTPAV
ncbi:MAG TPA: hypothetical protein VIV12_29665 [Streptosporangiaceae bacterium]